jgi:hypothetical protein
VVFLAQLADQIERVLMAATLRTIMLQLLFPAFLGTMLMVLIDRLTLVGWSGVVTTNFALGAFLALYYVIGYVVSVELDERYDGCAFAFDLVNVVAVYMGFYILGLLDKTDRPQTGVEPIFFVIPVWIGIEAIAWRHFVVRQPLRRYDLVCVLLAVAAIAVGAAQLLQQADANAATWAIWIIFLAYALLFAAKRSGKFPALSA